jgi:hypothetical protein
MSPQDSTREKTRQSRTWMVASGPGSLPAKRRVRPSGRPSDSVPTLRRSSAFKATNAASGRPSRVVFWRAILCRPIIV